MAHGNSTSGFILLGLFNHTTAHQMLFGFILAHHCSSHLSNTLMVLLIHQDPGCMYFLLSQLSLMDLMLVCTSVPKKADAYLTGEKSISPIECGLQIFFQMTGGAECFLLAAMSYDRYVAVYHLLQCATFMSWQMCLRMALGSWFLGAVDALMQVLLSSASHFVVTVRSIVSSVRPPRLACSDTSAFEYFICGMLILLIPLSLILTSYSLILTAVLHMCSTEACKKAFGTCTSHVAVVGLYYGPGIFIYMRPQSYRSEKHDRVISAFYTLLQNHIIYCLRNKDVKGALRKYVGMCGALRSD